MVVVVTAGVILMASPEVLVVQQLLKNFRLPLHDGVYQQLAQQGIRYRLVFSAPHGAEISKGDCLTVAPAPWYQLIRLRKLGPVIWQQPPRWRQARVIVVEQANKHLFNWWLLLNLTLLPNRCWPNRQKPSLVFWGHGFNHQRPGGIGEWLKRQLLRYPAHWLSYTQSVSLYLQQQGVAAERITTLNNSLDNQQFGEQVLALRRQFPSRCLTASPPARPLVLLFCGALYQDKQLPLLLEVCAHAVAEGIVAKLIVVGDGPLRTLLTTAAPVWLDYRGACFADDKVQAFAEADLVFNPGLVGLAILDAFAAALPFITTDFAGHSPEISYLQHQVNGLLLPMQPQALLEALRALQQDPTRLAALAQGASQSAELYSMAAMVANFSRGVTQGW
jgi:glycosyltransferase involved in cell wall biosynthesis